MPLRNSRRGMDMRIDEPGISRGFGARRCRLVRIVTASPLWAVGATSHCGYRPIAQNSQNLTMRLGGVYCERSQAKRPRVADLWHIISVYQGKLCQTKWRGSPWSAATFVRNAMPQSLTQSMFTQFGCGVARNFGARFSAITSCAFGPQPSQRRAAFTMQRDDCPMRAMIADASAPCRSAM